MRNIIIYVLIKNLSALICNEFAYKEEEEKKSKKNEIKRDSNGKVIINLSNRAHSSDKAQSPKKKVTVKVRNSPSDEEATSPQVNPSNEEPKDTVIDTDIYIPVPIDKSIINLSASP